MKTGRRVGLLLGGPSGDGSFIDSAIAAARRAAADGLDIDVRATVPAVPDASWDAVVCHGIQLIDWARQHRGEVPRVALTDRPGSTDGLAGVTLVDWAWDQAAYCAGSLAAQLAGDRPVGLIAGPPVPTQRRVATAYIAGAVRSRPTPVTVHHLGAFDAIAEAEAVGALLAGPGGCAVVAHAADAAGEAGCRAARGEGGRTVGFLSAVEGHVATVRSDVEGVLHRLLDDLAHDRALPPVLDCGLASGRLALDLAPGLPPEAHVAVDDARALAGGATWR